MAAYLVGLSAGFALGWLCQLWRTQRARARRIGGYVKPRASSTTNQPTDAPRGISFSSSPRLGLASAVEVGPTTLHAPSSTPVLGLSGRGTGGLVIGRTPRASASSGDAA